MAELPKLNAIGRGSTQHQRDMEALQRGGTQAGSLAGAPVAAQAPAKAPPPLGVMQDIEDETAAQQAANLEAAKTNPGIQEKLNMMAKARAKFYGEGQ